MPIADVLSVARPVLLVVAALQLLCATLLWPVLWRAIGNWWSTAVENFGLPSAITSGRALRILTGAFALVPLLMWWLLGLPAVAAALRDGTF
jgi:hypothetical protein